MRWQLKFLHSLVLLNLRDWCFHKCSINARTTFRMGKIKTTLCKFISFCRSFTIHSFNSWSSCTVNWSKIKYTCRRKSPSYENQFYESIWIRRVCKKISFLIIRRLAYSLIFQSVLHSRNFYKQSSFWFSLTFLNSCIQS